MEFAASAQELSARSFKRSHQKRKSKLPHLKDNFCGNPLKCSTFDESFKYYKRRCPPPDFSHLIDLSNMSNVQEHRIQEVPLKTEFKESELLSLGLESSTPWKLYTFCDKPGLLYVTNPFTVKGQQIWIERSLQEFTRKPHRLNIDAHPELVACLDSQDWWDACCRNGPNSKILRTKLRWSTLGYHHNWDTKVYSEQDRSEFPAELALLSRVIAEAAGFSEFKAEAAIVNFYHLDSTLAGHTDHSEEDYSAPLLSFSFGQNAIFLLGGPERSNQAVALLVRSGDIIIMSGESRLSYHGVPRIMSGSSTEPWNSTDLAQTCSDYLSESRINLNIRQVLKPGSQGLLSKTVDS